MVRAAIGLVADEDPKVRLQVAFSMGAFPTVPVIGYALPELLTEEHPAIVTAAFSSILPHLSVVVGVLQEHEWEWADGVSQQFLEIMVININQRGNPSGAGQIVRSGSRFRWRFCGSQIFKGSFGRTVDISIIMIK